ncbi:hypothetical protein VNO78_24081 [Psophocarpus tetragonolobus]|uniref:Uncharacterized protein n=1 Tax=Psophocarpus tetragonolobus TaxID=3891 RepID=A0AAN9S4S5_PSOTE
MFKVWFVPGGGLNSGSTSSTRFLEVWTGVMASVLMMGDEFRKEKPTKRLVHNRLLLPNRRGLADKFLALNFLRASSLSIFLGCMPRVVFIILLEKRYLTTLFGRGGAVFGSSGSDGFE